ncbi:hypothetical protein CBW65_20545 [Tumebacillus avium]|uniref:RES domain-containing protein n=1 Tax=Tumebacillus avium TaxID=1903704 RepID=A0A1Y0IS65_9BACL|nr:RES family NAD+ phosphorylase [Tumebacillus avium]ARU63100.1 hypothetical protein CBW65_20545 [Tumebacillus avium]
MEVNNEEFKKAYDMWTSFKEEVLYKNRFFVRHEALDFLKLFAEKNRKIIEKGTILYRARLYSAHPFLEFYNKQLNDGGELTPGQKEGFWGYDESNSFIPPYNDKVSDGRANPAYIRYLYTAETPYTALVEVRPYLSSRVSIAEIKVNETLNVADFSYVSFPDYDGFEKYLMYLIMSDFSIPTASDNKSYIPTQYISEYIKTLGFDGIRFTSSLNSSGRNITIFNFEKCKAIGSKLYQVGNIYFEANCIEPKNEKRLTQLGSYIGENIFNMLQDLNKQKE